MMLKYQHTWLMATKWATYGSKVFLLEQTLNERVDFPA